MPDEPIDLRRLPVWLQYLIALSVVALVGGAAWLVGRDRPVPLWITHYLVPALGAIYLLLLVARLVRWARRRRQNLADRS